MMNIIAITQARMGSTRLYGKVLKKVSGITLLEIHLTRIAKSKLINELVVATTNTNDADKICSIAHCLNVNCFRGSEEDVLDRYYQAAKNFHADWVVRVTSDCPLVDPNTIDMMLEKAIAGNFDYVSNPKYPDGFGVEVFKFDALTKAWAMAKLPSEREHVTPFIWKNADLHGGELFKALYFETKKEYYNYRLTVDEQDDFELIARLIEAIGINKRWEEYINYLKKHPDLININNHIQRDEGYAKSLLKDKHATDSKF